MISITISNKDVKLLQKIIIKTGKKLYSPYPWRTTNNKFHALTAELLLQRTNADQVAPVYINFISRYETPEDFINSPINLFASLGLIWRNKIYTDLCNHLLELKKIPDSKDELLKLPGIGEYIASAYRSLHIEKRDFIIDSNIVRLYGRFFGFETDGETRRKKWFIELADKLTPPKKFKNYNYGLLDFTRQICKTKPECLKCILKENCYYFLNNN